MTIRYWKCAHCHGTGKVIFFAGVAPCFVTEFEPCFVAEFEPCFVTEFEPSAIPAVLTNASESLPILPDAERYEAHEQLDRGMGW